MVFVMPKSWPILVSSGVIVAALFWSIHPRSTHVVVAEIHGVVV